MDVLILTKRNAFGNKLAGAIDTDEFLGVTLHFKHDVDEAQRVMRRNDVVVVIVDAQFRGGMSFAYHLTSGLTQRHSSLDRIILAGHDRNADLLYGLRGTPPEQDEQGVISLTLNSLRSEINYRSGPNPA